MTESTLHNRPSPGSRGLGLLLCLMKASTTERTALISVCCSGPNSVDGLLFFTVLDSECVILEISWETTKVEYMLFSPLRKIGRKNKMTWINNYASINRQNIFTCFKLKHLPSWQFVKWCSHLRPRSHPVRSTHTQAHLVLLFCVCNNKPLGDACVWIC